MRYERLADLIRLSMLMQGRADGISLDEIGAEFNVSRRTAERMRDALLDALPAVEERRDGGRKRWRLPAGFTGRLAEPTVDEIAALGRGSAIAEKNGDVATASQLQTLSDRLRAGFKRETRARLEPDIEALMQADGVALRPGPREHIPARTLNRLHDAILAGVWIEVDHRARASGELSRNARLGPIAMLLGEGRQYLAAYSEWARKVHLFALCGFERIDQLPEPFEQPEGFDLSAWMARSFGVWQEELYDVEWRFSSSVASDARNYLFHPSQTMTDEADGGLRVTFCSGGLREMCWHLFRWGSKVEIISPPELRAEMAAQLGAACRVHGTSVSSD